MADHVFGFPPPLNSARKKYPYLKRPSHLTDREFERIDWICCGFQSFDRLSEQADKIKNTVAIKRRKLTEQVEDTRSLEDTLAQQEKAAIRTRDPVERKKFEGECKRIRGLLLERNKRATVMERDVAGMEEEAAEVEEITHGATIINARSLVNLCKNVRRRRETEKNAGGGDQSAAAAPATGIVIVDQLD